MQFLTTAILALSAIANAAPSIDVSEATSKTYLLKTSVKAGQKGKSHFNNLYVTPYHSGAGENDVALLANKTNAALGSLKKTNSTPVDGHAFYNQQFDIYGSEYSLIPELYEDSYASWQPTAINVGTGLPSSESGFWFNSTGLQWSNYPAHPDPSEFDGWLACDWFRGVPQLFFLVSADDTNVKLPCSCAKVNLVPEYQ